MNFNAKILWYAFVHITCLFYFYLFAMKDLGKHQKRSFLQQQNAANQGLFYPLIDKSTMPFLRNEMPCYLLKSTEIYQFWESIEFLVQ